MNRALKREKTAVDIATKQNSDFTSNLNNLKLQLERAKKLDDDRVEMLKLSNKKASDAENALEESKRAYAELEKSHNELKTAADTAAVEAKEQLSKAKEEADAAKRLAEQEKKRADVAEKRAAEAEQEVQRVSAGALKCYEQGVYHMARCWWRDMQIKVTPDLEGLASNSLQNSTDEELLVYHSIIPFTPAEIENINAKRRGKGLAELEFGEVATENMRTIQEEMEVLLAEQAAAGDGNAAEQAGVEANVGDAGQVEPVGGEQHIADVVVDPTGEDAVKESEGSHTANVADGAAA